MLSSTLAHLIDIGRPSRAFPVTPPGIRVTYHGGSIGLCIGRRSEFRKANRVEIAIAQGLLDGRVAGHPPKWNTESGGSGTSIPEEVEQRFRRS